MAESIQLLGTVRGTFPLTAMAFSGIQPSSTSNSITSSSMTLQSKPALTIDWTQLAQLSEGNQEFEMELIKLFFVESKTLLTTLSEAIGHQNHRQVEHLAHQLKGSSGNMGFRLMSSIAARLELQARQNKLEFAPELIQELSQRVLEIQQFLE